VCIRDGTVTGWHNDITGSASCLDRLASVEKTTDE
jgi:hypothetical protein